MIALLLWMGCQQTDEELLSIKKEAIHGNYEHVEQKYLEILQSKGPNRNIYLGLADIWGDDPKSEVVRQRAAAMNGYKDIFCWLGGSIACLVFYFWNRLFVWFRVMGLVCAVAITIFPFYDDSRHKGTVIREETRAFLSPSTQKSVLFSLEKGSVVRILFEEKRYFLVEYEQKQGWVLQDAILSWDPEIPLSIKE